jgi:hypothetical protein
MCQGTRNKNHNLFKIKRIQSYTRDVRESGNNRRYEFQRTIEKFLVPPAMKIIRVSARTVHFFGYGHLPKNFRMASATIFVVACAIAITKKLKADSSEISRRQFIIHVTPSVQVFSITTETIGIYSESFHH